MVYVYFVSKIFIEKKKNLILIFLIHFSDINLLGMQMAFQLQTSLNWLSPKSNQI